MNFKQEFKINITKNQNVQCIMKNQKNVNSLLSNIWEIILVRLNQENISNINISFLYDT